MPVHLAINQGLSSSARVAGFPGPADLGVVSALVPPELVRQVVAGCGRAEQRVRALPAVLVAYFVIGLALFSGQGYREVLRKITGGVPGGCRIATSSALSRARRRPGPEPLEKIFSELCATAAAQQQPHARAFGRPLVLASMDGTMMNVPDTAANVAAFGEPALIGGGYGGGQAGYPQVRLLALIACGTRALLAAAFGPRNTSEHALARTAAAQGTAVAGTVILADRNFGGYPLVSHFSSLGADLIWRIRADRVLPRIAQFSDGSYLSVIPETQEGRRLAMARHRGRPAGRVPRGIPVRVIEADITITPAAGPPRTEYYRLITTLHDTRKAPAAAIARTYAMRWHSEMVFTQLAKRAVRPLGGGREHVADLYLVVGDDHAVDEQLGEQPPLLEGSGGEPGPDGLAEALDPVGGGLEFEPLAGGGIELPLLGGQGGMPAVQVLAFALELGQLDDLGEVGVQQALLLAV
jgi:hypothetical protein